MVGLDKLICIPGVWKTSLGQGAVHRLKRDQTGSGYLIICPG